MLIQLWRGWAFEATRPTEKGHFNGRTEARFSSPSTQADPQVSPEGCVPGPKDALQHVPFPGVDDTWSRPPVHFCGTVPTLAWKALCRTRHEPKQPVFKLHCLCLISWLTLGVELNLCWRLLYMYTHTHAHALWQNMRRHLAFFFFDWSGPLC